MARGSQVVDAEGCRQTTLLFPASTTAVLGSGGASTPLSTLHVRATEMSVGPSGSRSLAGSQAPDIGTPRQTVTTYNLDHQVVQISRPDGKVVDYAYDSAGRPTTVTSSWGVESYRYDPATGQLQEIEDVDGGKLTFSYDGGLLESLVSTGEVAGRLDLEYDAYLRHEARTFN